MGSAGGVLSIPEMGTDEVPGGTLFFELICEKQRLLLTAQYLSLATFDSEPVLRFVPGECALTMGDVGPSETLAAISDGELSCQRWNNGCRWPTGTSGGSAFPGSSVIPQLRTESVGSVLGIVRSRVVELQALFDHADESVEAAWRHGRRIVGSVVGRSGGEGGLRTGAAAAGGCDAAQVGGAEQPDSTRVDGT